MEFTADTRADPSALLAMIQSHPLDYKLQGPHKLSIMIDEDSADERIRISNGILERLTPVPHQCSINLIN